MQALNKSAINRKQSPSFITPRIVPKFGNTHFHSGWFEFCEYSLLVCAAMRS